MQQTTFRCIAANGETPTHTNAPPYCQLYQATTGLLRIPGLGCHSPARPAVHLVLTLDREKIMARSSRPNDILVRCMELGHPYDAVQTDKVFVINTGECVVA